jgi:hypothetical protein
MPITWTKPEYLGIKWDNGPNRAASPLVEITTAEFLRAFFCYSWGLDGLNYGGWAPLPDQSQDRENWYEWQYFFFHRQALAIAKRQTQTPTGNVCFLAPVNYQPGYELRFYRLGCLHPNMKRLQGRHMHDNPIECPDCGFKATYDSSG